MIYNLRRFEEVLEGEEEVVSSLFEGMAAVVSFGGSAAVVFFGTSAVIFFIFRRLAAVAFFGGRIFYET